MECVKLFPEGLTARDVMMLLDLGHSTVAPVLSRLTDRGHLKVIAEKPYRYKWRSDLHDTDLHVGSVVNGRVVRYMEKNQWVAECLLCGLTVRRSALRLKESYCFHYTAAVDQRSVIHQRTLDFYYSMGTLYGYKATWAILRRINYDLRRAFGGTRDDSSDFLFSSSHRDWDYARLEPQRLPDAEEPEPLEDQLYYGDSPREGLTEKELTLIQVAHRLPARIAEARRNRQSLVKVYQWATKAGMRQEVVLRTMGLSKPPVEEPLAKVFPLYQKPNRREGKRKISEDNRWRALNSLAATVG